MAGLSSMADAIDRARALNAALTVARLRRLLHVSRSWLGVGGVGASASLALSRHELAAALDFAAPDEHIEFLFRVFGVGRDRVDLLTLLVTTALLSQGPLEDKAQLVFSLVDLDTEDDITEDELALVVAACSDGLTRLGVAGPDEHVSETDAIAVAYEAFSFAGVDDGDKMNMAAFVRWLSFHPRPQALFDRLSCLFSMCDIAKQLRRLMERHQNLEIDSPVEFYNLEHWGSKDKAADRVHVLAGPAAQMVTDTTVDLLLEVDVDAAIKCFAFPCAHSSRDCNTRVQAHHLRANEPSTLSLVGLTPGTTYIFRLLGVCRADRERCVGSATTRAMGRETPRCCAMIAVPQALSVHAELTIGPVVGFVSDSAVTIMVEANQATQIGCVLTARFRGGRRVVEQRTRANQPVTFKFEGLTPGSIYDVSFQGLNSPISGVVQTHVKASPAFRLTIISDDLSLDGPIVDWVSVSDTSSYLRNIASNLLCPDRDLQSDLTIHLGCVVAVAQLVSTMWMQRKTEPDDNCVRAVKAAARDCVRRHWGLPDNRCVLSHGGNWFSNVGVSRSLLLKPDVPVSLVQDVRSILLEYERVGCGSLSDAISSESMAYRLGPGVILLTLDTMECMLENTTASPFCEFQDKLLSVRQWEALEHWFSGDLAAAHAGSVNTFIILCDIGLVSVNTGSKPNTEGPVKSVATSWSSHPSEQVRFLELIFRQLDREPQSSVLFVCGGSRSSRSTITEVSTSRSFQHVVVGPVSRSSPQNTVSNRRSSGLQPPTVIANRYRVEQVESGGSESNCCHCVIDVVPHPRGSNTRTYLYASNQPDARILVGPVIGRVTARAARILVELDRPAVKLVCILTSMTNGKRVATEASVEAFTPVILKMEGLQPGTRYRIEFEGVLQGERDVWGVVSTPASPPLTTEWLVVNHNTPSEFLRLDQQQQGSSTTSSWNTIAAPGMRSFTALASGFVSHANGDTLGNARDIFHPQFNPWYHIEDEFLSDPMHNPDLLLHLGGQVDMRAAFSDDDLVALVHRMATVESFGGGLTDKAADSEIDKIRRDVRHRMQEVYRVSWGNTLMQSVLSHGSNLMLLDVSSDLYSIHIGNLRSLLAKHQAVRGDEIHDGKLQRVVDLLVATSFELWQLYQNQLWGDVSDRDLDFSNKTSTSKFAYAATFGIARLVFMNVNPEVHAYCSSIGTVREGATKPGSGHFQGDTPSVSMFSTATWKVFNDVVEGASDSAASRKASSSPSNGTQQLVVVLSADIVEWGGTNNYPELRPSILRLLEALFVWKLGDRQRREVTLIGRNTFDSSMSYSITDEKVNERVQLLSIGSVSIATELQKSSGGKASTTKHTVGGSSAVKGYFSKRFTFQSTLTVASSLTKGVAIKSGDEQASVPEQPFKIPTYRTFASFQFFTDLRRGILNDNLHIFPPKLLPKAVTGPVLGRMIVSRSTGLTGRGTSREQTQDEQSSVSIPILLETDAAARVTCIVTDALAHQEVRVAGNLTRHSPHVFVIDSLLPERRYVYRFEGISNGEQRRGNFHTPSTSVESINFLCASSNFPTHLDEATDCLWVPIRERVTLPWGGIDFLLHLGGQVPLHEAAIECVDWVNRELKTNTTRRIGTSPHDENVRLRRKVRERFQQHYRRAWNLPNLREVLANCSNWFLRSQADVAPFFGNSAHDLPRAVQLVLDEAKRVVADYQLALMRMVPDTLQQLNKRLPEATDGNAETQSEPAKVETQPTDQDIKTATAKPEPDEPTESMPIKDVPLSLSDCTAKLIQHDSMAFFVCDMRSTPRNDFITCNDRLKTPLTQQENAMIGETQWQQLETALKVKKTQLFVLCIELPLVLTNADHVDEWRESSAQTSKPPPPLGPWKLYDHDSIGQHWVACRRQLEQLLHVLFRWKVKRRGRDVIVVSGGMQIGLDSFVRDQETGVTLRNLSTGPVTAHVEPFSFPTSGVACPEFLTPSSNRFTFTHSLLSDNNYALVQCTLLSPVDSSADGQDPKTAQVQATMVTLSDYNTKHPVEMCRRLPSWWSRYLPMGASVFWDDTVTLRAASDDDMLALLAFVKDDRSLAAGLEALYDKYQFAETARIAELRSAHRQHFDLKEQLRRVFAELWRLLPEPIRRQMAFFLDPYVADLLLAHVAPALAADPPSETAMELERFSTLCRDFVFNASLLRLCLQLYEEDTLAEQRRARQEAQQRDAREAERAAELERLQAADPDAFTRQQRAERDHDAQSKEARRQAKLARKTAARAREVEEELAIAREQQQLSRIAETDTDEYARRAALLETRVRRLDEAKQQRAAERAARAAKKNANPE